MTARTFYSTDVLPPPPVDNPQSGLHEIIKDVEDLKYNDAQSDIHHSEWSTRIDGVQQFVAPDRSASPQMLEVDQVASDALFKESLVLLPGMEQALVEQADWSESACFKEIPFG